MDLSERLQVFISSVMSAENMAPTRAAAEAGIRSIHLTRPWAFESSPAEPNTPEASYLRAVAGSDMVVAIVSNGHSKPVQRELDAAEEAGIPILAFVRALKLEEIASSGRDEVLAWLGSRVKYEIYYDDTDLGAKIPRAIASELVRSYRQYRITQSDIRELVRKAPQPKELLVREPRPEERLGLQEVLRDLVQWYPNIDPWITKTLGDVGSDSTIRIADVDGSVAGIAISREKEDDVRKFATIYVRPGFQGEAIGPHLVYQEVRRAAQDHIRKAYVSFAEELRPTVGAILSRYGFIAEGISGSRYRHGSAEWVMGKAFEYQRINSANFDDFIRVSIVRQYGGKVLATMDDGSMKVVIPGTDLFGVPSERERELVVVPCVSPTPERDYEYYTDRLGAGDGCS